MHVSVIEKCGAMPGKNPSGNWVLKIKINMLQSSCLTFLHLHHELSGDSKMFIFLPVHGICIKWVECTVVSVLSTSMRGFSWFWKCGVLFLLGLICGSKYYS